MHTFFSFFVLLFLLIGGALHLFLYKTRPMLIRKFNDFIYDEICCGKSDTNSLRTLRRIVIQNMYIEYYPFFMSALFVGDMYSDYLQGIGYAYYFLAVISAGIWLNIGIRETRHMEHDIYKDILNLYRNGSKFCIRVVCNNEDVYIRRYNNGTPCGEVQKSKIATDDDNLFKDGANGHKTDIYFDKE